MTNTLHTLRPDPVRKPAASAYYELVHDLSASLPPPEDDSPEALRARIHAAILEISAMQPANADEAKIAMHCVAARARAEEMLLRLRRHKGDTDRLVQLGAQYALMERTANGCRSQLLRVQAARHKREQLEAAAGNDAWSERIAFRLMQDALGVPPDLAEEPSPQAEPVTAVTEPPQAATPAAAEHPPAAIAEPLPPVPGAEQPPPVPAAASAGPPAATHAAQAGDRGAAAPAAPANDLAAEAERYAILYPRRARLIRDLGGVPRDCDFGPPEAALVRAIVSGTTPALRALDATAA